MGGNSMSALQDPIEKGDLQALHEVLDRYGPAVPLLLSKQFTLSSRSACLEIDPVFVTPLKFCISHNEPECLRALLKAGGDPNEGDRVGATLLHRACKRMSVECVRVLLENGARVYDCDEWGVYPIHCCVGAYGDFQDSLTILDVLLEAGDLSDIHLKDAQYEKLPLHYAAYYGNKRMCKRLIELGADINGRDKNGRTAYESSKRQKKVQNFLKEQGCEIPEPVKKNLLPPLFPIRTNIPNNNGGERVVGDLSPADPVSETITTEVEINHQDSNRPLSSGNCSENDQNLMMESSRAKNES